MAELAGLLSPQYTETGQSDVWTQTRQDMLKASSVNNLLNSEEEITKLGQRVLYGVEYLVLR